MKVRAIVGKRVVAVEQARVEDSNRAPVWDVTAIVFDDGTRLTFTVAELEGDYAICAHAWKNGKQIG